MIDHVEPRQMFELLEAGCDTEFCYIVGIIADLKQTCWRVSSVHEQILQLPRALLSRTLKASANGPDDAMTMVPS